MNSKEIYQNINLIKIVNEINVDIQNVVTDSRLVKPASLYIAIKGDNFDGNNYYQNAFENGASIAIVDNVNITSEVENYLKENNKSLIIVEDSVKALGQLAKYKRSKFNGTVVAITGSAGKTSTKDMVYSVLSSHYNAFKTFGNHNNHLGLPLTILAMPDDTEILVVEMGMNHLGEISYLTDIARPDIAIITNVGTAHIGNLGSRENILKAKLEILEGLNENGHFIINNDNDLLHSWYESDESKNYKVKTFAIINQSEYMAQNIVYENEKSSFIYNDEKIKVPIGGEHFIYNALAALTAGEIFNIPLEKIKKGILNFSLSQNRMNIINNNGLTIIDDSYNANFDSLKYALKFLGTFPERKIAVIGTMLELGKYSQKLHTELGNFVVSENIDILITVGNDTEFINQKALELGFDENNQYHFTNNLDAINLIDSISKKDDVILIKASNGLKFKEIVEHLSK